jgi:RNA polymerase sigma-70 factor (ECF subfamily)
MDHSDSGGDAPLDEPAGQRAAIDEMLPLVYGELRRVAASYLKNERAGHTLQPTALVHEAYVRLAQLKQMRVQSRAHLLSLAAQQMRRVLVDHARAHGATKRGGEYVRVEFEDVLGGGVGLDADLVDLDVALDELARMDARLGSIVELRFFGGLSIGETAEALGVSHATIEREWATARAWLRGALRREGE